MSFNQITPNPVVSAAVEIRFNSTTPQDKFAFYFGLLGNKYPKITPKGAGFEIVQEGTGEAANQPVFLEFTFENDNGFSFSFAKNAILFEVKENYPLWKDYFKSIMEDLKTIQKGGIAISSIQRLGIRYISLLPSVSEISKGIKGGLDVKIDSFDTKSEVIRNQYEDGKGHFSVVQVANGITMNLNGGKQISGLYVDIDVSKVQLSGTNFDESLFSEIDSLHSLEKTIFRSVFTDEYFATLNVK